MDTPIDPPLSAEEARVLGSLIEKDLTTPEYYPLSANALMLAANQKSNRDPVVDYDEPIVLDAVAALRHRGWAAELSGPGMRVAKYRHRLGEKLNLGRGELGLLAVLLLRGPQTLAELRERTSRMHSFEDIESIVFALRRLPDGYVTELARQPGWKETRWAQLLCGPVEAAAAGATRDSRVEPREALGERVARLETELAQLRAEFDELKRQFS